MWNKRSRYLWLCCIHCDGVVEAVRCECDVMNVRVVFNSAFRALSGLLLLLRGKQLEANAVSETWAAIRALGDEFRPVVCEGKVEGDDST